MRATKRACMNNESCISLENEEMSCSDQNCCDVTNPACRMLKDRNSDEEGDRRQRMNA